MTDEHEVIGVIDRSGETPRFVVADAERDDAWVSCIEEAALALDVWR